MRVPTASVLDRFQAKRQELNAAQKGDKKISLADLIVLAGSAGAKKPGHDMKFPLLQFDLA
jgi:catalase-peroxidase